MTIQDLNDMLIAENKFAGTETFEVEETALDGDDFFTADDILGDLDQYL